ncbi:MAG TPA: hypothetical protein VF194_10190, partial [Ferrovibrio sp.]|uniref:hypothetical protein n=1 Tax=Ferrovibrio sp. TaxID=1917215 RepID=UPI002ED3778B
SEIALFRHEGVTAIEAEPVQAPADTRTLYRVERESGGPFFTHVPAEASKAYFEQQGYYLSSVAVID